MKPSVRGKQPPRHTKFYFGAPLAGLFLFGRRLGNFTFLFFVVILGKAN